MQTFTSVKGTLEYRIAAKGRKTVLIFPGGHMDASINLGEDFFANEGYQVIVLSRPGYGKTTLSVGASPAAYVAVVAELLESLKINKVVAVGISAGGRSAVCLAAQYPALVEKLILQCATSFAPWPDTQTRRIARIAFNPFMERLTWLAIRTLLKVQPRKGLRMMLSNMTTLNPDDVVSGLNQKQSDDLIDIFARLQSGKGFMNDLQQGVDFAKDVHVPTLIIHSKYDKSVSLDHAERLHAEIKGSRLFVSAAESHMIWFSGNYPKIQKEMKQFLGSTQ